MSSDIHYYFKNMSEFPVASFFDGLTEPWQALKRSNEILDGLLVKPDLKEMRGTLKGSGPSLYGNYFVDEGTVVYNDVTILGPVYIGKNCEIMPGAILRPYTILGDGCSVGHGSELKRCVLQNGAKIASLAFAGDSVLGKSARIGSGVITANRKFDQSDVAVRLDGKKVSLNGAYFGCVLGDFSRLGANCVTQPGTHIGPYTWVFPLTAVHGFIPREKRVYEKKPLRMDFNEMVELK